MTDDFHFLDCTDDFCIRCRVLPARRLQGTGVFEWGAGLPWRISVGFNLKGTVGEVFALPIKTTPLELTVQDCAIAISHLLQAPRRLDEVAAMFSVGTDPAQDWDRESYMAFLIRGARALEADYGAWARDLYHRRGLAARGAVA